MKRIVLALPLLVVLVIGGFAVWGLNPDRDPNEVPSALVSNPAPDFDLPPISGIGVDGFGRTDLVGTKQPTLVNVFASWCVPCRAEHAVLTRMVNDRGVRLAGINYKDKPQDARAWLADMGNPYQIIGSDIDGLVGIEWGISGVPETFVVDVNGIVTFRYVGPIIGVKAQRRVLQALEKAAEQGADS